tara:strand:- start:14933 stop:16252 length:1320 start_codon:yes stop_codon:yes gene_type:complete
MAYGKGLKIYRSLATRTTRAKINQRYASSSYRRTSSSSDGMIGGRGSLSSINQLASGRSLTPTTSSPTQGLTHLSKDAYPTLGGDLSTNGQAIKNDNLKKYLGALKLDNVVMPSEMPFEGAVLTVSQSPFGPADTFWTDTETATLDGETVTRNYASTKLGAKLTKDSCRITIGFRVIDWTGFPLNPNGWSSTLHKGPDPAGGPSQEVINSRPNKEWWDENGYFSMVLPNPCSFYENLPSGVSYMDWAIGFFNSQLYLAQQGNIHANMLANAGLGQLGSNFEVVIIGDPGHDTAMQNSLFGGAANWFDQGCAKMVDGDIPDDPNNHTSGSDFTDNDMPFPSGFCSSAEHLAGNGWHEVMGVNPNEGEDLIYTSWQVPAEVNNVVFNNDKYKFSTAQPLQLKEMASDPADNPEASAGYVYFKNNKLFVKLDDGTVKEIAFV